MPFCAALSDGSDQTECYRESIAYLKGTYEKTAADIAKDCRQLVNPSERCVELAGR
jgi:hypothetical protein